jgi:hypothetical protein
MGEDHADKGISDQLLSQLKADLESHWQYEKENQSALQELRELIRRARKWRGGKPAFSPKISRRWARSNLELLEEVISRLGIPLVRHVSEERPDAVTWSIGMIISHHQPHFRHLPELQKLYIAIDNALNDLNKLEEAIHDLDGETIRELQSWNGEAAIQRSRTVPHRTDTFHPSDVISALCKIANRQEADKLFDAAELSENSRRMGATLGLSRFAITSHLPVEMIPEANHSRGKSGRHSSPYTTATFNLIAAWEFLTGCRASSPTTGKQLASGRAKSKESTQWSTQFVLTALRLIDREADVQAASTAIRKCIEEIDRRNDEVILHI